jgi:hypothetical protein
MYAAGVKKLQGSLETHERGNGFTNPCLYGLGVVSLAHEFQKIIQLWEIVLPCVELNELLVNLPGESLPGYLSLPLFA